MVARAVALEEYIGIIVACPGKLWKIAGVVTKDQ